MCGIAGVLNDDPARPADLGLLRRMNDTLVHRGPDGEGFFTDGPLGMAMRRLSIIDLTTGDQPIANEAQTVWVVFNGEIYNFAELRDGLEAKGHRFKTASDTEVIVHLYEEHGLDCVRPLRGMFAFALWDQPAQTLLLVRDRLGVKPLYYAPHRGRLTFGSELKALLADPRLPRDIDPRGLSTYLRYGYIADPLTILSRVSKLPPGHLLLARPGHIQLRRYWDVTSFFASEETPRDERACEEEIEALLTESVRLRLVSDVPLGAFLSGGVDSSTVVALMARAMDRPVKTFSIGFADPMYDERPHAREVARHLGAEHEDLILTPSRVDVLDQIAGHFDEPFGDPSALPTYFVSKLARQHVTVALSGDGGDEVFGGYDRYLQHLDRGYADRIPETLRRRLRPLARSLPDGVSGKRWLHNLSLPSTARYLDSVSYFPPRLQEMVLDPDVVRALPADPDAEYAARLDNLRTRPPLARMQALDFQTYLPGDILVKVDRMSMAHSLEAREPLLDHVLVERVAALPTRLKIRRGVGKYLLKRIALRHLPPGIVTRPKQGFAVPLSAWFDQDLGTFLHAVLRDSAARQRGYLTRNALQHLSTREPLRRQLPRLWLLAMLELWHRTALDHGGGPTRV